MNSLWELPTERVEECIVAKLPPPSFVLPRQRKCPVPRPLTKWEKFAQEKGIKKTKKDAKVFDEELDVSGFGAEAATRTKAWCSRSVLFFSSQKWVPRYGMKRAQAEKEKDWVLEVPRNADPMEDQFEKKQSLKSDKVAKNEIQRMRNIVRAKKIPMPRSGYLGPEAASSSQVNSILLGKFAARTCGFICLVCDCIFLAPDCRHNR